ncbi:conserved hypothetical protein [Thiomonas arsenitoxydans]|uniref:Uncharacterized protein n=1 Tax=Thiomonas arsenitoxydans (strain DSM 22701 / CIP 110005 / 3As) TaxID=426114 RepID=D6CPR8_THIA3|nr:hypothetical protein THI_1309 [Thiomonas arsenitoxydans]CQR31658.1 conserved hypothetical protein [Thiomonas arsenitoxydans]
MLSITFQHNNGVALPDNAASILKSDAPNVDFHPELTQ